MSPFRTSWPLLLAFVAACSAAPQDDVERGASAYESTETEAATMDSKTVAETFFRLFDAGDIEGAFALVDDGASWWVPGTLPFSGTKTKAQYVAQVVTPIRDGFPSGLQMKLTSTIVEGERVAAEVESSGQHRNGRTYNNRYHFILVVRGGRIVEVKEYMDTLHLAQLIAPPG